jgi:hypothetical protein
MVRFALYLRTGESRTEAEERRSGRAEACETPQTTCQLIAAGRCRPARFCDDGAFLPTARATPLETEKVVGFAARIRDVRAQLDLLRLGTASAVRTFVPGWGFFGSAPDGARATAQAMRAARRASRLP